MKRVHAFDSRRLPAASQHVLSLLLALGSILFAAPVWADEPAPREAADPCACPDPCEPLLPVPDYAGCIWRRPKLTGDWCDTRRRLAETGVFLSGSWYQAAQGVLDGGTDETWAYHTNLDYTATLDLARLRLVPGAIVTARAQSRFGSTVNGDAGLLLPVNSYGLFPFTDELDANVPFTITELNWTQMLSETFGFIVGKITTMSVANEFAGGLGRSQFMNFQFIFPSVFAQIGPYSTLAAGLFWTPTPRVSVSSLLLNTADSSTRTGFDDFDDGQTWFTTATVTYRLGGRPGGVTLGGGYAFGGDFARIGGLNIDPGGTVTLDAQSDNWAAFLSAWQYLVTLEPVRDIDPEDGVQELRGLGAFAILGVGDPDVNPTHWSIAGGLSGRGLVPGRCDDTCGLGYFYNRLGDVTDAAVLGRFVNDNQGIEAYYNLALAGSIGLTIDAQWAKSGIRGVADAWLLGLRLNVDF